MAEALKPEHGLETLAIQKILSSLRRLPFPGGQNTDEKLAGACLRARPSLPCMPVGDTRGAHGGTPLQASSVILE